MLTQKQIRHVVAENVRRGIEELEQSVDTIAKQAGFTRDHLYKILREETDVSFEKLGGLARALEVDVADLFTENVTVFAQAGAPREKRPRRRNAS